MHIGHLIIVTPFKDPHLKKKKSRKIRTRPFYKIMPNSIVNIARSARLASVSLQSVSNEQKNEALLRIKQVLNERRQEIFEANEKDKQVKIS